MLPLDAPVAHPGATRWVDQGSILINADRLSEA